MKQQWVEYSLKTNSMKKFLLVFSAILTASIAQAQTDASVMLSIDNAVVLPISSSSAADYSYIATLPSGENIITHQISAIGGERLINVKKISATGGVSTLSNLIIPSSFTLATNMKGLSCSASGAYTCLFGDVNDLFIVKFNSAGAVLWQKQLNVPSVVSIYYNHSLNETPSGDYYVSVSAYGFMGIIKLDANGNVLWTKRLAGPRDDGKCPGFCSEVTLSGGCISTLKDENFETIINLAPDGSLIWSRSYTDMSYRWTKSIKKDNLGNFYILGTYGTGGATFVQKIDANGNFIYAKNLSGTTSYHDAIVTNSNEFILLSTTPSYKLTKLGATGNVTWSKGIGAVVNGNPFSYSTLFSKSPSANISFHAWLNDTSSIVFKFSGDPNEICNNYNFPVENTTDDAQILAAELDTTCNVSPLGVNVTNTTFSSNTTEYYQSTDFCSYIASVNETTTLNLNIYPNPATDFVNIELGNLNTVDVQNALLVVYDMTGKKVFEKQLTTSSMDQISTVNYPAGLYTIIISNPTSILAKQRVIVQK